MGVAKIRKLARTRIRAQGVVLLTVGRSYIGHDITHSTLVDRACATARVPTEIFLNIVPTALVTRPPGAYTEPQRLCLCDMWAAAQRTPTCPMTNSFSPSTVIPRLSTPLTVGKRGSSLQPPHRALAESSHHAIQTQHASSLLTSKSNSEFPINHVYVAYVDRKTDCHKTKW